MSTEFASAGLTAGELNAIVKKLGGHDMALRFLRDELTVTEPTRSWRAAAPTARLVKVLTVTCEGNATASHLVQRGKYSWSNDLITDQLFPLQSHGPTPRTIELLDLGHDWSWEEGLAILTDRNLDRPTPEDCLYVGIQHPDEQCAHPIAFPHEPVQGPRGYSRVLVLDGYAGGRKLGLSYPDDRWRRRCLVAGVRKVA